MLNVSNLKVALDAEAGLVKDMKMGRERLWQLDPTQIEEARKSLEIIGRQWAMALGKLKAFVEDDAQEAG